MDGSQGQGWSLVVAVNRSLFETCYPPDVPGRRRLSCRCKWFTVSTPTIDQHSSKRALKLRFPR